MKVVSLCFEVCYPQRNALSVKKSKAKTGKIRHESQDIHHLHEIPWGKGFWDTIRSSSDFCPMFRCYLQHCNIHPWSWRCCAQLGIHIFQRRMMKITQGWTNAAFHHAKLCIPRCILLWSPFFTFAKSYTLHVSSFDFKIRLACVTKIKNSSN